LITADVISAIINGTEELIKELDSFKPHSTGGETADVGDIVRTIIVDSTVTARMKRSKVIDMLISRQGCDRRFGLFGQATYEKSYNGVGSKGLTSARHDVFEKYLATKYPESFDGGSRRFDLLRTGKTDGCRRKFSNRRWTISAFANENLCTIIENFR
jgi:phosphoribosylformylglycinamidine cyclo-ligase